MDSPAEQPSHEALEPPTCNCVILCDDLVVSQVRRKHSLNGLITIILVRELPTMIGPYMCYIRLSNVYPSAKLLADFRQDGAEEPLWSLKVQMPPRTDPLGLYTIPAPIPPFGIEQPGRYLLTIIANGVPLAATPIKIVAPSEPEDL